MSLFLSAVTVLFGAATAGNLHSNAASTADSVSQIRSTLQNLLRSIRDNGQDAEEFLGKRQLWCDSAIHAFDASNQAGAVSLLEMQSQLTETLAAVMEAKGTLQQVHVDMDMVRHTINQTEDMQKSNGADTGKLRSLADNKRLSLASLRGQLKVAMPVLAQLQGRVAETRQRISYRSDSIMASKDFMAALRDGCQKGADRSDKQAAARVGESNSIHAVLQALDEVAPAKAASDEKDDDSLDGQASALSFVQRGDKSQEVTLDDLHDLFSKDRSTGFVAVAKGKTRKQRQAAKAIKTASSLAPHIQTLLTELKDVGSSDQETFCSKQRESSMMAMKFAQDSVAQSTSEAAAHTDAEAELGEELKKLQASASAVTESSKTASEQASKEVALIQGGQKDQQLATKILDQAAVILGELGMSNATKAVSGLLSAKKVLAAQVQSAAEFQHEASAAATAISQTALALTQAQESEQNNLEFARDDHASQRLRAVENKRLYEADAHEATIYVQKLEESCKADVASQAAQQRSVQVHALEDADSALTGKLVEAKSNINSLRGADASHAKPTAADKNLTPMQRAAAEMGISAD